MKEITFEEVKKSCSVLCFHCGEDVCPLLKKSLETGKVERHLNDTECETNRPKAYMLSMFVVSALMFLLIASGKLYNGCERMSHFLPTNPKVVYIVSAALCVTYIALTVSVWVRYTIRRVFPK